MDPISIALGVVGLGMQIFGGVKSSEDSHRAAQISQDEARQEQGINDEKQKAMEIDAKRKQLEIIRNNQRMMALATNNAVNQNAQFGSGLQGGLAQVYDQSMFNLEGVNSALETGRNINQFNKNISQDKIQMAGVQADQATDQGFMSLGGSLLKAGPLLGPLSQGFGGSGRKSSSSTGFSLFNNSGLY